MFTTMSSFSLNCAGCLPATGTDWYGETEYAAFVSAAVRFSPASGFGIFFGVNCAHASGLRSPLRLDPMFSLPFRQMLLQCGAAYAPRSRYHHSRRTQIRQIFPAPGAERGLAFQ